MLTKPMKRIKRIPLSLLARNKYNWTEKEVVNREAYCRLGFAEGYTVIIANRPIGLHRYGEWENWQATDIKTGACLSRGFERRRELLDWLIQHEEELTKKFKAVENRIIDDERFLEGLLEKYDDKGEHREDSKAE